MTFHALGTQDTNTTSDINNVLAIYIWGTCLFFNKLMVLYLAVCRNHKVAVKSPPVTAIKQNATVGEMFSFFSGPLCPEGMLNHGRFKLTLSTVD